MNEPIIPHTKHNRSNTADNLNPFLQYFYSGTKIIKYGAKRDKMLAERKKDVSFISNLYSGNAVKKMVRQRHPSMFKGQRHNADRSKTPFEAANITKVNRRRIMNHTNGFEIIEGPLIPSESLKSGSKMRPFTNEKMSQMLSPNLQKQKHEHEMMMKQYQDKPKINYSEALDDAIHMSNVLEKIQQNEHNSHLANRPIDILYIEVPKNMTRDLMDRNRK